MTADEKRKLLADGDAQFQIGVVHGFADEPLYQWQDPFHQERYETGYTLGRWQRVTQALDQRRDQIDPYWAAAARRKRLLGTLKR